MKEKVIGKMTGRFTPALIFYGILMALLIFILKIVEYRYFVRDLSLEFYIGVVAIMFTIIGIWIGLKLFTQKRKSIEKYNFRIDREAIKKLGISNREYEVLELISKGHSNQEIADKLFISLPTVKTHSSSLFVKLDVRRRTQAVKRARELQLIP